MTNKRSDLKAKLQKGDAKGSLEMIAHLERDLDDMKKDIKNGDFKRALDHDYFKYGQDAQNMVDHRQ